MCVCARLGCMVQGVDVDVGGIRRFKRKGLGFFLVVALRTDGRTEGFFSSGNEQDVLRRGEGRVLGILEDGGEGGEESSEVVDGWGRVEGEEASLGKGGWGRGGHFWFFGGGGGNSY